MFKFYWINWKKDNQETRMLKVLWKSWEIWVFKLIQLTKIAHYTEIVRRLRLKGYKIKQRSEFVGNIHKSYYKLIK